jgi:hypothetical protein
MTIDACLECDVCAAASTTRGSGMPACWAGCWLALCLLGKLLEMQKSLCGGVEVASARQWLDGWYCQDAKLLSINVLS